MAWEDLVKVALIGTDRSSLTEQTIFELSKLGINTDTDHTQILLEGASFFSLIQKTGGFPKNWKHPLPNPAPEESDQPCSTKSRSHLKLILREEYQDLLPEFVFHVSKNHKILPLDLLPDLLNQCLREPELWKSVHPAIGKRGFWLIQQNQDWQTLNHHPAPDIWETGNQAERIQLLDYLRKENPQAAIPLILSTWDQDSLSARAKFVKSLEANASLEDEPFLEECLQNSRKEIRKPAAHILAGIAESKLCQRIFLELKAIMEHRPSSSSKKEKLTIKLPEKLTDNLTRDGIDPSSRWYKGGVKASRLGQMIAIVPPHFWEAHFKKNAPDTLHLFIKTEWSELILQAITEASIRHRNMDWTEAILLFWLDNFQKARWQYFNPLKLFNVVNTEIFNKIALIHIKRKNSLIDEESPLSLLLRSVNLPWHDILSKTFIEAMKKRIAGETSHYWSGWHLRPILKKAAVYTNPKLFDQLVKGWSTYSHAWTSWEKDIEHFLSVLKFRKDMIEELEKN